MRRHERLTGMRGAAAIAIALCSMSAAAGADAKGGDNPAAFPDPTTVSVPDLSVKPGPREKADHTVQFYFHKPGATFSDALADYTECNSYSVNVELFAPAPKFVPYGNPAEGIAWDPYGAAFERFGLVGVAMMSMIQPGLNRSLERGNLRRCMAYRGYRRYGATNAAWKEINTGSRSEIVTRLALIAAGAAPPLQELGP